MSDAWKPEGYVDWSPLASGAEAQAWLARRAAYGQRVVIRAYFPPHAKEASRQQALLASHPGIEPLPVLESGWKNAVYYTVRSYAEGISPALLGPVSFPVAAHWVLSLCKTLERLHSAGLVHGDLHSGNLVVRDPRECVLVDMGSVREAGKPVGAVVGALCALSPEHVGGVPRGPASDVFSCGLLLYRLLTGEDLFDWKRYQDAAQALLSATENAESAAQWARRWSRVEQAAWPLLDRCLRPAPQERWEDAAELGEQLEIALDKWRSAQGPLAERQAMQEVEQRIGRIREEQERLGAATVSVADARPLARRWWPKATVAVVALLALYLGIRLPWKSSEPSPATLQGLADSLLAHTRRSQDTGTPRPARRLLAIPAHTQYDSIQVDGQWLPPGTEILSLSTGTHRFRGKLRGGLRWKTARIEIPASGPVQWNWDLVNLEKP